MIYQADWLFPGDGPPIRDGWIQVERDRIAATGSASGLPADIPEGGLRRFGGCAILPGLVNAHCHLELTALHDRLDRGKPFPTWAQQLRGYTAALDHENYRHAAREGVRRLLAGGCATVLDVGNTGAALEVLAEGPLRALACVETLGQDPALAAGRFGAAAALAGKFPPSDRFRSGLAPHAAYSCSPDLLRRLLDEQVRRGLPVTIHAAESREEAELFASGTGPLAEYCRSIYPAAQWAQRAEGTTTIRWLESQDCLPDGVIIVHGNMLDDQDMDILARRGATVVHCPSSHAFFAHPRFPYEKLKARGIPVALGTDSLASGDSLSMLDQMRLFSENYPEVPVEEVIRMATVNGARALGLNDTGLLKAGYRADFVAIKIGEGKVFGSGLSVPETFVDGKAAAIFTGS
jgi:cytosine/adenosine deaminase-related metal-dependent hydrolase